MIRDVADIYNRNLIHILLVCVVLVIPISFFSFFATSYIVSLETVEFTNIPVLCLIILNFTLLFPPFFYIVKNDVQDKEVEFKDLLAIFFHKFGIVAFITIGFYVIGVFGSFLFLIPTFFAGLIILLHPLFSDKERVGEVLRSVWKVIKREHVFILLDIIIIVSLNALVWSGSLYLIASFENNMLVYITLRALINSLLFPIIYFYLSLKYRKDLVKEFR